MEGLQALLSWLQRRCEAGFYESLVDRRRLAIAAGLAGTAIYSLRQRRGVLGQEGTADYPPILRRLSGLVGWLVGWLAG